MLIAAGVSHRTAKLDERERVALQRDEVPQLLQRYRERYGNGVVLSTCNRTEVYVHTGQRASEAPPGELMEQLADFKGLSFPGDLPAYYCLQGAEVPRHLFSVASGVDSQVLGEGQILGQVREALSDAAEARSLDAALARLLHDALRTGKRARTETPIGRYAVSVSSAAVDLAREHVPALPYCRALVVGAGAAGCWRRAPCATAASSTSPSPAARASAPRAWPSTWAPRWSPSPSWPTRSRPRTS